MFDEYLEPPRAERPVSPAHAEQALVNSAGTPSSTTIDQDAPTLSISSSSSALQFHSLHQGVATEPNHMSFIASSDLPSIYIQQFWDMTLYDKKAGCYKCQLDEQWFDLAKETLREALQITPVNRNQAFAAPPLINGLIDFPAPTSVPAKTQEHKCKQAIGTTDKPAKAKRIKRSISRNTRQSRGSPKSVGASEAEEVPAEEPRVAEKYTDFQKAVEESMKDAYALPKGPLPLVVIREPESGKYQPLPEVPGKGNAKVYEEQVAHDLLSLQKHKKTSPADQYIFQRRVS
nr:hypothetical protein [Tanacetum cinerariifolium]